MIDKSTKNKKISSNQKNPLDSKYLLKDAYVSGHRDIVSCSIKIDEKTIASGSNDNTIRVWDIEKKEQIAVFEGHQSLISS
ncbi:WD40 repeat domain-containing protein, partial [Halarcobacter sp.]|uniref:WD40 repeat domain-containing protein n=1 Tax=Halarcobacter sp. TaxID=2321133 RepID=UPI003A8F770E